MENKQVAKRQALEIQSAQHPLRKSSLNMGNNRKRTKKEPRCKRRNSSMKAVMKTANAELAIVMVTCLASTARCAAVLSIRCCVAHVSANSMVFPRTLAFFSASPYFGLVRLFWGCFFVVDAFFPSKYCFILSVLELDIELPENVSLDTSEPSELGICELNSFFFHASGLVHWMLLSAFAVGAPSFVTFCCAVFSYFLTSYSFSVAYFCPVYVPLI